MDWGRVSQIEHPIKYWLLVKKYLQREQVERIEETTKELEGPLIIRGDVAKISSQWEGIGNVYVSF